MRTATEILESKDHDTEMLDYGETIDAINEARIELIHYIASKTYISDDNFNPVITKKEILDIIKEIKE